MATISKDRIKEIKNKIKMSEAVLSQDLEPKLRESYFRYTSRINTARYCKS
jgi:hypothetical protein